MDGCIYFVPYNARSILKLDPEDDSLSSVGDHLGGNVEGKYIGTVIGGNDDCLYGVPNDSHRIVRFNPLNQEISFVGEDADEFFSCIGGGVLGRDGHIYAVSFFTTTRSARILKIDIVNNTWSFVGNNMFQFSINNVNVILGNDGCIYLPPHSFEDNRAVLQFDPVLNDHPLEVGDGLGRDSN